MKVIIAAATLLSLGIATTTQAQQDFSDLQDRYEVTITNLTRGQVFTPILAVTHSPRISLFQLGAEPSQELADLAEGGDTSGFEALLEGSNQAFDVQVTMDGLIGPGESRTVTVTGSGQRFVRLSLAGMLLPTNDTFVAVDSLRLPRYGTTVTAMAYDAGSEDNDELCASIPGPQCGGEPFSEGLGEGYVHVSSGISGEADLPSMEYDWHNPVARVSVRRVP